MTRLIYAPVSIITKSAVVSRSVRHLGAEVWVAGHFSVRHMVAWGRIHDLGIALIIGIELAYNRVMLYRNA